MPGTKLHESDESGFESDSEYDQVFSCFKTIKLKN